jgi:hypothetical protein
MFTPTLTLKNTQEKEKKEIDSVKEKGKSTFYTQYDSREFSLYKEYRSHL